MSPTSSLPILSGVPSIANASWPARSLHLSNKNFAGSAKQTPGQLVLSMSKKIMCICFSSEGPEEISRPHSMTATFYVGFVVLASRKARENRKLYEKSAVDRDPGRKVRK